MAAALPAAMRTVVMLLFSTAVATAEPALTRIDHEAIPEVCVAPANLAESPSHNQALSARIALANCMVDYLLKPIVLCDCEQVVREIDTAIEPSLAFIDEVYLAGDSTTKIFARHAQAEMLTNLAIRMLATVPPPVNDSEVAIALRDIRLQLVQTMIEPWLARARDAYGEVDQIARANPELAKNAAVVAAVRSARARTQALVRR